MRQVISDRESEIAKLNQLAQAGASHGFIAPRAWESDDEDWIEMERIDLALSSQELFRNAVCRKSDHALGLCSQMVCEAGRVLASIHDVLARYQSSDVDRPNTFLHCDYGFSNTFLDSNNRLVVIDPFPPEYLAAFDIWHVGSRSIDLGMFASCLIGRVRPRDSMAVRTDRIPRLLCNFLDQYNHHANTNISMESVIGAAITAVEAYLKESKWPKRLLGGMFWMRNLHRIESLIR